MDVAVVTLCFRDPASARDPSRHSLNGIARMGVMLGGMIDL